MPELPEVETVVRTLRPVLLNRRLRRVELTRQDIVTPSDCDLNACLRGRTVTDITRRGKRIVLTLDDGNRFYVHLGMTGRLTVERSGAPVEKHTHLLAQLSDRGRQLRFRDARRFGGIWWMGRDPCDDRIGPEPLTLRIAQLSKRLARTMRAIKNVLLDQTVIAGLGNIYADEALFAARIHPLRRASELTPAEVRRLNRAVKLTLRRAVRHRGSTLRDYVDAEGERGAFQNLHRVYDRAGEPCRSCKRPIERIVLGGRSTHYCPNCQPPLPARARPPRS
jgi:formamidopyrimidine-DNA glycosylase